jgi:hypothetical protein
MGPAEPSLRRVCERERACGARRGLVRGATGARRPYEAPSGWRRRARSRSGGRSAGGRGAGRSQEACRDAGRVRLSHDGTHPSGGRERQPPRGRGGAAHVAVRGVERAASADAAGRGRRRWPVRCSDRCPAFGGPGVGDGRRGIRRGALRSARGQSGRSVCRCAGFAGCIPAGRLRPWVPALSRICCWAGRVREVGGGVGRRRVATLVRAHRSTARAVPHSAGSDTAAERIYIRRVVDDLSGRQPLGRAAGVGCARHGADGVGAFTALGGRGNSAADGSRRTRLDHGERGRVARRAAVRVCPAWLAVGCGNSRADRGGRGRVGRVAVSSSETRRARRGGALDRALCGGGSGPARARRGLARGARRRPGRRDPRA